MRGSSWVWIAGLAVAAVSATAAVIARLTASSTASRLGIDNAPDDDLERQRLLWLAGQEALVLGIILEVEPHAHTTSAYRSDASTARLAALMNRATDTDSRLTSAALLTRSELRDTCATLAVRLRASGL